MPQVFDMWFLTIKKLNIEIISVDISILEKSQKLLEKYPSLGIFDSIHAATAMKLNEKLISTDTVFYDITEIENIDPRNFKKD